MSIRLAYDQAVQAHGLDIDPAQQRIVKQLDKLQQDISADQSFIRSTLRRLKGQPVHGAHRGIYLWGGVGRGKTFLMDLFFDTLDYERKKRIHFHRMMSDVHHRLHLVADKTHPLKLVAEDIASEIDVLCFDEFFVSDIADAMILGRLLEELFRLGVTLIATSNSPPEELYRDGLQRQRFLPAIDALKQHTEVVELDAGTDYRFRLLSEAGTYLTPISEATRAKLQHYFDNVASSDRRTDHAISVLGREIRTIACAKGVAWFDFNAICDGPRSQEDYIEISRWYPTVIVSDIPVLTTELNNQARRFIALVDEFYDRRVKLVLSAADTADALYQGQLLEFEFQRTLSRLTEMQSEQYLHAAHVA